MLEFQEAHSDDVEMYASVSAMIAVLCCWCEISGRFLEETVEAVGRRVNIDNESGLHRAEKAW